MCPKLIELLSWNGPTAHVCRFMLARASTKTFVNRIHIRQPSPKKQRKNLRQPKNWLAESFVSRGITVLGISQWQVTRYCTLQIRNHRQGYVLYLLPNSATCLCTLNWTSAQVIFAQYNFLRVQEFFLSIRNINIYKNFFHCHTNIQHKTPHYGIRLLLSSGESTDLNILSFQSRSPNC